MSIYTFNEGAVVHIFWPLEGSIMYCKHRRCWDATACLFFFAGVVRIDRCVDKITLNWSKYRKWKNKFKLWLINIWLIKLCFCDNDWWGVKFNLFIDIFKKIHKWRDCLYFLLFESLNSMIFPHGDGCGSRLYWTSAAVWTCARSVIRDRYPMTTYQLIIAWWHLTPDLFTAQGMVMKQL